jgi:seryl-tRNA synthetase
MTFISFRQWRESSPATRNKAAAAKGLQPMYSADVFGHSTPPPHIVDALLKKLKKNSPKKNPYQPLDEKVMKPNYSIDGFIKKAKKISDEIADDLDKGKKEADELAKKKAAKEKAKGVKGKKEQPQVKKIDAGKPHFPPLKPPAGSRQEPEDQEDQRDDIEKQNEANNWERYLEGYQEPEDSAS